MKLLSSRNIIIIETTCNDRDGSVRRHHALPHGALAEVIRIRMISLA